MAFLYGIPCGLIVSAFMMDSFESYLAGVVSLVVCLCTSRVLAAIGKMQANQHTGGII